MRATNGHSCKVICLILTTIQCSCTSASYYQSMDSDMIHMRHYEEKIRVIDQKIDSLEVCIQRDSSDSLSIQKRDSLEVTRRDMERIVERDRKSALENAKRGNESSPYQRSKQK